MEFAPSGQKLSFEVTFDAPNLFVGMTVFDTTGASPVLVAGPTAMSNTIGNTYLGYFSAEPGKSYLIYKAVYTDGSYSALNTSYAQGTETISAAGIDLSRVVPIIPPVNGSFYDFPDVSEALMGWLQPMIFNLLTKSVDGFINKEVGVPYFFQGVWQPFTSEQLIMKPEGQRSWEWVMVHSLNNLPLKNDDVIYYEGVQYRVTRKLNYTKYGYYEYEIVNDYSGAGP